MILYPTAAGSSQALYPPDNSLNLPSLSTSAHAVSSASDIVSPDIHRAYYIITRLSSQRFIPLSYLNFLSYFTNHLITSPQTIAYICLCVQSLLFKTSSLYPSKNIFTTVFPEPRSIWFTVALNNYVLVNGKFQWLFLNVHADNVD